VKKDSPRGLVLDKEKIMMKFHKHKIINNKTVHGKKVLANVRYVKDVFQVNRRTG
jgi:hypothetical protein